MFRFYLGRKFKVIDLNNSEYIKATLTTKINEPLSIELDINLKLLAEKKEFALINYLIDWNSTFYLELENGSIGYTFRKKHNQYSTYALIGENSGTYKTIQGTELLPNSNYFFSNGFYLTKDGVGVFIGKQINNASFVYSDYLEYIRHTNVESSQNMINQLKEEKLSITSQTIENDILHITLFSTLILLDYSFSTIAYGKEYKDINLSSFLSQLLPNWQINLDSDRVISYTVENKNLSQILDDVIGNKIYRCAGEDINTFQRRIDIYDSTKKTPSIRCVNASVQSSNPRVLSVKQNFPTMSASIDFNSNYIREGERVMMSFSDSTTIIKGSYLFEGASYDLLDNTNINQNVTLQESNQDVRYNYLDKNIRDLSQKFYE